MKKLLLAIFAISMIASIAGAEVLWDQSATRPDLAGHWNSESPGMFGGGLIYEVDDFSLDSDVILQTITTYYTNTGAWTAGTCDAHFDIYPKVGPLPIDGVDDPLVSQTITVNLTDIGNSVFALTATDLDISLAAGQYWVLMSPILPQGNLGTPEFQIFYDGDVMLDPSAGIEFGGMFGPVWADYGDSLDGSILIEGSVAVGVENSSLSTVKSLFR